ncbi:uncharacterized protein KD926_001018 [Aspergillus affinis]|uniref:uncharacterized protein n=1 Tax=Aspergillus affinis TaxID=1070780 RepID=UPI0022FDD27D|nr:uncharacterized protein KD926_001018 [Aspergillus affinis]KAI9044417.1 hypothetical protein KD926_001018 [Aspergillus affinis]
MSSIIRSKIPPHVARPSMGLGSPLQSIVPFSRRKYAQSSYGGEGEHNNAEHPKSHRNSPTRDIEHPGPTPPNVSKDAPSSSGNKSESHSSKTSEGAINTMPSNKAHPTITDGQQSPNIDSKGNLRDDVPQDVKQHNKEMSQRHDRAYNQIADEGEYRKGF